MTKPNTRIFTGNEVATIAQNNELFNSLNIRYIGIKDANKLNKLLIKCNTEYNSMINEIGKIITQQNEELINNNPNHAELLKKFATIRHDLTACNKFIHEHKELEFLVPTMEEHMKKIVEIQEEIGKKTYEFSYTINNDNSQKAIEDKGLTLKDIAHLLFLFD